MRLDYLRAPVPTINFNFFTGFDSDAFTNSMFSFWEHYYRKIHKNLSINQLNTKR